jgi:hypothetical protein
MCWSKGSSCLVVLSIPARYLRLLHGRRWSIWFEFFLLIIMLGTCFSTAFDRARFIYLTYLALVTVLLTQVSRFLSRMCYC